MAESRVVPMKFLATWEPDRGSSNCVPRICTLKVTRLVILKSLEPKTLELNSLAVAVKLQGNKRTLRSNDIMLPPRNGNAIEVDLDISFTLQYPHFMKKKNNFVYLMLQRRKKYKNRTILGFKTLAIGSINLTEVLQKCIDRDLPLYSGTEAKGDDPLQLVARLSLMSVGSQPIELDESKARDVDYSEEDEDDSTNEEGGSDSEPVLDENETCEARTSHRGTRTRGPPSGSAKGIRLPPSLAARQTAFKQKVVSLLKKFKVPDEVLGSPEGAEGAKPSEQEIEALFEELEELSPDSGPEMDNMDTISVESAPKPGLRPYFGAASSREALPPIENGASEESKESDTNDGTEDGSDVLNTSLNNASTSGSPVTRFRVNRLLELQRSGELPSGQPQASSSPKDAKERTWSIAVPTGVAQSASSGEKKKKLSNPRYSSADAIPTTISAQSVPAVATGFSLPQQSWQPAAVGAKELPSSLLHKPISEQLSNTFTADGTTVPASIIIASAPDLRTLEITNSLQQRHATAPLLVSSMSDVKAVFSALLNRIQRFCHSNNVSPNLCKIVLFGNERFTSRALRVYTELFAQKPSEWMHYIRFFVVSPDVNCPVARFLSTVDGTYAALFNDVTWRETVEKNELMPADVAEIVGRVMRYVQVAQSSYAIPIAEAMLQCREKGGTEEQSQLFIPFLCEIRIRGSDAQTCDTPVTDSPLFLGSFAAASGSGSPPASSSFAQVSPPSSPHATAEKHVSPLSTSLQSAETVELQIEYWSSTAVPSSSPAVSALKSAAIDIPPPVASTSAATLTSGAGKSKDVPVGGGVAKTEKTSLKTSFRSLVITRSGDSLTLTFTKEKKQQAQKMLQKLGMKNKEKATEVEHRSQVGGVSRIICSAKPHTTIKVVIDGVEWTNVKFFQVSSQWQTHVKHCPMALFHFEPQGGAATVATPTAVAPPTHRAGV